ELAYQIRNEYARFTKLLPKIKVAVVYGGNLRRRLKHAAGAFRPLGVFIPHPDDDLIAFSSRLRDEKMRLASLKRFVFDECVKMLDQ
ncbi:hypothetical protein EJ04DRAFT_402379, partial [Polyplosphaeria fusca]